jgi:hypothetical protein
VHDRQHRELVVRGGPQHTRRVIEVAVGLDVDDDAPAALGGERGADRRGRANRAPVQPSTAMPNYPAESLNDAQAKDIYAYIRSFTSRQPPVEKIPVMNQILEAARKPYTP